jgi:hypothetical protein
VRLRADLRSAAYTTTIGGPHERAHKGFVAITGRRARSRLGVLPRRSPLARRAAAPEVRRVLPRAEGVLHGARRVSRGAHREEPRVGHDGHGVAQDFRRVDA